MEDFFLDSSILDLNLVEERGHGVLYPSFLVLFMFNNSNATYTHKTHFNLTQFHNNISHRVILHSDSTDDT